MDNKIFDDKYRMVFIRNADFKTLNEYLKNMERLSKKGGKYLEIYNKDMEYLLNNDILNSGPDAMSIFFGNNLEIDIGDTETNIQQINKITQNTVTKNKVEKNNIVRNLNELSQIEICIRNEYDNYTEQNIRKSTKNFVDIVMSCSTMISDDESKKNFINCFKIIASLIRDNKIAVKEGYKVFSIILSKNKNRVAIDFIKNLKSLHNGKNKISVEQYNQQKYDLIDNAINIYGLDITLSSILFQKIYNEYKKK